MRVPQLSYEELSSDQKTVWDEIVAGPRGKVSGPFLVWLHRHELLSRGQALGLYARFNSGLEPRLSELTILIVSCQWDASIEWHDHYPNAVKLGVNPDALEAMRTGAHAKFGREDEQALYEFVSEYFRTHEVSDATYAKAIKVLGQDLVIDLVGVVGYYGLVAMTLKVFQINVPGGAVDPFART